MDTGGRGLELYVHPASEQDRDGAPSVLNASRACFPFMERVFAGSVRAGERVAKATAIAVEIVRGLPDQVSVQVLPRRWVLECHLAWINRNRRLAYHCEGSRQQTSSCMRLRHAVDADSLVPIF
jgi:hypothetical protein